MALTKVRAILLQKIMFTYSGGAWYYAKGLYAQTKNETK